GPLALAAQLRQLAAGPRSEVALVEPSVDADPELARASDRCGGLAGAFERGRVHGVDAGERGDALGGYLGLCPPRVGEVEAGGPRPQPTAATAPGASSPATGRATSSSRRSTGPASPTSRRASIATTACVSPTSGSRPRSGARRPTTSPRPRSATRAFPISNGSCG